MAISFVSPGVSIREIDASFLGPGVGAIGAAIVGAAAMGPAFVPVTVTTFGEYVSFFGDLNSDFTLGYAARAYLKNAGSANIVRVLGPEGRTVNGTTVNAGYSADSMWAVCAKSGSIEAVMALLEITGTTGLVVTNLSNDLFFISGSAGVGSTVFGNGVTASFLTSSANYIKKVLNTDPTQYSTYGYYLREVYDYTTKLFANGVANFSSASYGITNFQFGYNSGSTPWIKSQLFGGANEYNLFRIHTLGHGEVENGRFKVSITNIRPSAAPTVTDYGKFDLEIRDFGDTDRSKSVVELWPNLSLDPTDNQYIARVIGDRLLKYDVSRGKMVDTGNFANASKIIRVEMTTGSIPAAALPWGFRGLDKPVLSTGSTASAIKALPYVADLLDKETQSEARTNIYFGMETQLSGNVKSRFDRMPSMTGSDADFSLSLVSGSTVGNLVYNTSNPAASQKSPGTSLGSTTLDSITAKFTVPIAFGFDGFDRRLPDPLDNASQLASVSQLGTQALRQGIDIVADPDFIDINLLAIPGIYSSKVTDYGVLKTEARSDAFYIMDVTGSNVTAVVNEVNNRGFDTNYASVYYPGIKVFDDVNKVAMVLPSSIAALGAMAFNDRVGYPWLAPAGLNRAGLSRDTIGFDVLGLQDQLTQAERDTLYEARINPIARFPDVPQGVIWGQKTLQLRASALDRINVRRLLIRAKKLVASATKFLVFEPGDATTMTRFKQLVNPILADIQQKRGLEKFLVVMDSTLNTPDVIDRNQLKGQIFLVPSKATEFIAIDFIISPSGATFNE